MLFRDRGSEIEIMRNWNYAKLHSKIVTWGPDNFMSGLLLATTAWADSDWICGIWEFWLLTIISRSPPSPNSISLIFGFWLVNSLSKPLKRINIVELMIVHWFISSRSWPFFGSFESLNQTTDRKNGKNNIWMS